MEEKQRRESTAGMSLLEVVLAVAIFAAVIGVTAQSLLSFYVSIDVQEQRMEALQSCRSVMGAIREQREQLDEDWPAEFVGWIDQNNAEGWQDYLSATEHEELRDHALVVIVESMEGQPPSAGDAPLRVVVRSSWLDRRNRPLEAQLVTALNDR